MSKIDINIMESIEKAIENVEFSGIAFVKEGTEVIYEGAAGFADRTEARLNRVNTRFGIASGCKLFTAIAICQLAEKGIISFNMRLKDCLDTEFPYFNETVTIHHLLTHTSGIPDYFDEDVMDDFEEIWKNTPMYLVRKTADFLPLFQNGIMKFSPGEKFHYNNAAFIVLGLIVEKHSGLSFTDYVGTNIFEPCKMNDSGYFSLDQLPKNTANGYIDNEDGAWKTNAYSIPIIGGPDGGAYITANDINKLWEALFSNVLLSKKYTDILLRPHVQVKDGVYYGYGVWMNKKENNFLKYHIMGYDPGVSFHSAVYPERDLKVTIASNKSSGAFQIMKAIEDTFEQKKLG
ncbi:serine hydrolase domain-containing protein [Bacillus sp. M6-12]|uniref:serine hydrolase domain-containing protein n=1 Tax=Bacillus sp. M6-12 TaxID=2054166 RepID=UPI00268E62B1